MERLKTSTTLRWSAKHVLKKLEVKHFRKKALFWKRKAHSLAMGANQLLSYEHMVSEYYNVYLRNLPPYDDEVGFRNRVYYKENVEYITNQILRCKEITEKY